MTTNAQLAARLLREAAGIYRTLAGNSDGTTRHRFEDFSGLYERVAELVESDPEGTVEGL
ncbi:MAG: hypothetical protein ACFCUO_08140 [Rhodospirillales bacterium]